jgi:beta-galactosidase/beta-glucuronidase
MTGNTIKKKQFEILDLTGSWQLTKKGSASFKPVVAHVPGGVHPALIAAGIIPDISSLSLPDSFSWISKTTWVFERPFFVDAKLLSHDIIDIEFDGIDTYAEVKLNGTTILNTDNMFKTWKTEVKELLKIGENTLTVEIAPATPTNNPDEIKKARYGFGTEFSPECITAGICRPVRLRAWNQARIVSIGYSQQHDFEANTATVFIGGLLETSGESFDNLELSFRIYKATGIDTDGFAYGIIPELPEEIKTYSATNIEVTDDGAFSCIIDISAPELWYPNGMSPDEATTAPIYKIEGLLYSTENKESKAILDQWSANIGLRTLETIAIDDDENQLAVLCNGKRVFLRGATWIPPSIFPSHIAREEYEYLIRSAADANINAIKLWENGIIEDEYFWELCDTYGIIVLGLPELYLRIGLDDEDANTYRPFQHPSIPDNLYLDIFEGDRVDCIKGLVSFPSPETFIPLFNKKSLNINSKAFEERSPGKATAELIAELVLTWPIPSRLEDWIILSQIANATEVVKRIEAARKNGLEGVMFEPYASCWPLADGSAIDSEGRWKALHYMAGNAFNNITIFGEADNGKVKIYGSNLSHNSDSNEKYTLVWRAMNLSGEPLDEGEESIFLPVFGTNKLFSIKLDSILRHTTKSDLILWLDLLDDEGYTIAQNYVIFDLPRRLELNNPQISLDIEEISRATADEEIASLYKDSEDEQVLSEQVYKLTLTSTAPALYVWLNLDGVMAQFSNNFICLKPDEPVEIYCSPLEPLTHYSFQKRLSVGSLYSLR